MQTITDTYEFQKERIIRIVEELAPGKAVEFDDASTFIRFRVRDPFLNINLTEVSGDRRLAAGLPPKFGKRQDLRANAESKTNRRVILPGYKPLV